MHKFNIGDRAMVNEEYDNLAVDRDKLIGAEGTVVMVVPGAEELLFFKTDDDTLDGAGPHGTWAVVDYELDKLEA